MAQEQDEASSSSYYDLFDDQEMMMDMALLPPHFGADAPEGGGEPPAHATQLGNRTTTGGPVPPPGTPNYPYPTTTLPHTRVGARHFPVNTTTAPSPTRSLLAATPATATSTSYPLRPIVPFGVQPTLDWVPSANNSLYNSSSDSGSQSAPNPFSFTFGAQNTQPSTTSGSYSDYVAPDSLQTPQQPNFDFSYPTSSWNETRDGNIALAGNPLALSSSIPADDSVDAEALPIFGSASTMGSLTSPRHKRAKSTSSAAAKDESTSPDTSATYTHASRISFSSKSTISSTGVATGSNGGGNKTKLRSASRTSKNTHHKPAETAEERKTRASHNLVEKQYRNRLNAQFESLLNVLPDTVHTGGGDGDSEEQDPERRVSKAEVLDRARRHIKQLERDRAQLEHERDELLGSVERLQETYTQGLVPGTGVALRQPGPSYTNPGEGHAGSGGTDALDETLGG